MVEASQKSQDNSSEEPVTDSMKKELLTYCFNNVKHFLKNQQMLEYPSSYDSNKFPLFVTWQKDGDLRGCIGTFDENGKLGSQLQRYSLIAALNDSRFEPVTEEELPSLRCEISLLSNFEKIENPLDWEIGKHGIEIEFAGTKGGKDIHRGTFLPNVAPE